MTHSAWQAGPVWRDERVDDERVLAIRDAGTLAGRPVLLKATATGRAALARVEESTAGSDGRVHPTLARRLGATQPKFPAQWRRAHRLDVLVHGDRDAAVLIALTALAAVGAAVIAVLTSKPEVRVPAIAVAVVTVLVALLKARGEWSKLMP